MSTQNPQAPPQSPAEVKAEIKAAGLRYVADSQPGIRREKHGDSFRYLSPDGAVVEEEATLTRIKALGIPPAYEDVWICRQANGYLQATGRDAKGRKQYRYHPRWRETRDETKYGHMREFGKALPEIRARVTHDLGLPGLPREKVLATIVRLLETTLIRVGNKEYAKENQHYGLTTLRNRHLDVEETTLHFHFTGKSGKQHEIDLQDRRLAGIVKRLRDLPGYELFQYLDENGERRSIDSADVNAYLHEIVGSEFRPKISEPGPERCWPPGHFRSVKNSSPQRRPNGISWKRSKPSPGSLETPRRSAANPKFTPPCWTRIWRGHWRNRSRRKPVPQVRHPRH